MHFFFLDSVQAFTYVQVATFQVYFKAYYHLIEKQDWLMELGVNSHNFFFSMLAPAPLRIVAM